MDRMGCIVVARPGGTTDDSGDLIQNIGNVEKL